MTRIRVPLGKFIKEYSERNKGNEDIPVYSVTNSQGFCTEYFGKEVASQDKTTYKIVPQGYFAYNPSRINVGSVDWQRYEKRVIVSPLYNVFSVSEGIDRQYLYYFLRSDLGRQMIKAKASGSVRDNLKLDHSFFHYVDQSIQSHCHNTEQNNRHEKPIHLKYLTGIDDQISKSAFGSEKFSDNDSHKTKSDIDFHIAYDCRNRGRQYNFCKRMPAVSVQCIYQFDLFLIDIDKGGIQIQDTSEDGDGHSGNNNCF